MHRLAALLLSSVMLAVTLTAAPAPRVKPSSPSVPWVTGWDRPEGLKGDCRFARVGDKLSVIVSGKGRDANVFSGELNGPRLLREVSGDFSVQLRVNVNVATEGEAAAGILLRYGKAFVLFRLEKFRRVKDREPEEQGEGCSLSSEIHDLENSQLGGVDYIGYQLKPPVFLRVIRRGDTLTMAESQDGVTWETVEEHPVGWHRLPRRMKVGIFVGHTNGDFTADFDRFEITPLAESNR